MNCNFNLDLLLKLPDDDDSFDDVLEMADNIGEHCKEFDVPKNNGRGKRHIVAPEPKLKWLHKRIYYRLLSKYRPSIYAHGFVRNRRTKTYVEPHVGCKSMGHFDIKDFFDSISEGHILNSLMGNYNMCKMCKNFEKAKVCKCDPSLYKNVKYNYEHKCEEVMSILDPGYEERTGYTSMVKLVAKLCTKDGYTCQGFSTSPMIANIVLKKFDIRIAKLLEEHGCVYTRYADDILISSKTMTVDELKSKFYKKIKNIMKGFGFNMNYKKTKWRTDKGRLIACNIVFNKAPTPSRRDMKLFRAKVHHATVKHRDTVTRERVRELKGYCSYVSSINKEKATPYMAQLVKLDKELKG